MEIRCEARESTARLVLTGRLDASWADHLVETVAAQVREGRHAVELELSGVEFLSSAGIRALLRSQRQVAAVRGSFALLAPGAMVRGVLKTAGLSTLVRTEAERPRATQAESTGHEAALRAPTARAIAHRGPNCDWSGALDAAAPNARLALHGEAGRHDAPALPLACGPEDLVVGIGALGCDEGAAARAGEFLAAAGLVAAMPTDGSRLPDYVLAPAESVAETRLVHALRARGSLSRPLRFESRDGRPAPLSELLSSVLDIVGGEAAACVLLVECAELVGAALLKSPSAAGAEPHGWPQVRDNYSCTTEKLGEPRTALVVAVAARPDGAVASRLSAELRAHGGDGVAAHAHALVFPYRPLPKLQGAARVALEEQFAASQPLSLVHLLHDDRDEGLGESLFLRGTAWVARADAEVAT